MANGLRKGIPCRGARRQPAVVRLLLVRSQVDLRLRRRPALRAGVYAVRMRVQGQDNWHNAVANFGTRPTVSGQGQLLEVHCLEGQPELYGRRLWVEFHDFLRPEQRFEGLDALKSQIERDVATARRCLE